jgi:urease accessory protein
MKLRTLFLAALACALTTSTAFAHPHHGVSPHEGFGAGFAHPWLGIDHLLAMIAVGLLGAQMGGRALWVLPCSFLAMMSLGGAIAMSGRDLLFVQPGIALSVIALGAALAIGRKYPLLASAAVIGAFGLLHGHAHGTELAGMASAALYAAGFVSATALLHFGGVAGGLWLVRNRPWATALRLSGVAISCVGMLLLVGAI